MGFLPTIGRSLAERFWGHTPSRRSFAFPSSKVLHMLSRRLTYRKSASFPSGTECLSRVLHAGIRFFRIPLPTSPRASLAIGLPTEICRRGEGLTTFRISHTSRVGRNLYPDSLSVPVTASYKRLADCVPFWLRPVSIFGLFQFTRLAVVHFCSPFLPSLAPSRVMLAVTPFLRKIGL